MPTFRHGRLSLPCQTRAAFNSSPVLESSPVRPAPWVSPFRAVVASGAGDAARPRERFVAAAILLAFSDARRAGGEWTRERAECLRSNLTRVRVQADFQSERVFQKNTFSRRFKSTRVMNYLSWYKWICHVQFSLIHTRSVSRTIQGFMGFGSCPGASAHFLSTRLQLRPTARLLLSALGNYRRTGSLSGIGRRDSCGRPRLGCRSGGCSAALARLSSKSAAECSGQSAPAARLPTPSSSVAVASAERSCVSRKMSTIFLARGVPPPPADAFLTPPARKSIQAHAGQQLAHRREASSVLRLWSC